MEVPEQGKMPNRQTFGLETSIVTDPFSSNLGRDPDLDLVEKFLTLQLNICIYS
jgi:hypothetical protein